MKLSLPKYLNILAPIIVDDLIRVGGSGDGGYVVSGRSVKRSDALISFGLCDDWSFEQDFLKFHPNACIDVYDHTVSGRIFYRSFRKNIYKYLFKGFRNLKELKRSWAIYSGYRNFFKGPIRHYRQRVYNKVQLPGDATIDLIMSRVRSDCIFLKMDIEGGEYRVIEDILKYADRIVGLAIEFHDTDPLRETFVKNIQSLQKHFSIVHLHPNNCGEIAEDNLPECIEISFIKSNLLNHETQRRTTLPVSGLDMPCTLSKEEYAIQFDFS